MSGRPERDGEVGERTVLLRALDDERSQQLIKQAHREWLAALDAIHDPIFIHDKDFRVMRSNRAYAECASLSVKEVVGRPYYEMFPRQDGPCAYCRQVVEHGGSLAEELTVEDGRVFLVRVTAVSDSAGHYLYSLHIMYDITERKRMEQALREGDERLQLAFSAAHQAWFDLNLQTGTAAVSPEYPAMVGYDTAEFDTSLQHWIAALHPDDRDAVMHAFQASLANNAPPMEYRRRTKSGEWKWIKTVGKVVGWDAQQRPLRMIGIHTDVTERKLAELALAESEARFRSMFESMADGVLLFGRDGRIQISNPAAERILGLDEHQLIGAGMAAPDWVIRHENMEPFVPDELPVNRALSTGQSQRDIVIGLQRPPGMLQWLSVNAEPIFSGEPGKVAAAIVSFEDITARKRNEERLVKLNHALRTLSACNHTLVFAGDELQLLQDMCRVVTESGGYLAASVGYAQHDEERTVRLMAQSGLAGDSLSILPHSWAADESGQAPGGGAIRNNQIEVSQDIGVDPLLVRWRAQAMKLGINSCIALPLSYNGEIFGCLNIYAGETDAFGDEEVALLKELAEDLSFGIETQRMRREQARITEQLRKGLEDTVQAISSMVEMRDPYTAGHERRVADLAAVIAAEMGLSEDRIHGLHLAGTIHDLGKIQVPAEILSKPGRLNEVEYSLVRLHPQTGYDILKNIEFPWPVAEMVLQHHERMDGSGYPHGLSGDDILLEARILGLADVVEAMASHRPYRPGLGLSAALDELRKNSGKLYDPQVVDACVRVFEQGRFPMPENWSGR